MSERDHEFKDPDGCRMRIKPSADETGCAYLDSYGDGIRVPAHRLAEFCGAVYESAGQPVPDLPAIYDPATVSDLSRDMNYALHGTSNPDGYEMQARVLLSLGWVKP